MTSLYDNQDFYEAAFPGPEAEELAFYRRVLAGAASPLLSLGCGDGRLEAALAAKGMRWARFDLSPAMVRRARRRDPRGLYAVARMEAPPFGGVRFGAAMGALLSVAYVTQERSRRALVRWLAGVLVPGAPVVLELPVAHRPPALQGIEERAELPGGAAFRFQYLDELERGEGWSVIDSVMEITRDGERASRRAPLVVFTPRGIRELLEGEGLLGDVMFFACYDAESGRSEPPQECLKAMVVGRRT